MVPSAWSLGHKSSAVSGSLTTARILSRICSATISLASRDTSWSANMLASSTSSPVCHAASNRARWTSGGEYIAWISVGVLGTPSRDHFAALR